MFRNFHEIFKYFKVKYFIVIPSCEHLPIHTDRNSYCAKAVHPILT